MKFPRWLNSPLAATTGVLVGLSLIAIPLHQLTSAPPTAHVQTIEVDNTDTTPAWVNLKLLEPASSIRLTTPAGKSLWSIEQASAGNHETRINLPIHDGDLELVLEVTFTNRDKESAAFLSIAPDRLDRQTRHTIGSGNLVDLLTFNWPQP